MVTTVAAQETKKCRNCGASGLHMLRDAMCGTCCELIDLCKPKGKRPDGIDLRLGAFADTDAYLGADWISNGHWAILISALASRGRLACQSEDTLRKWAKPVEVRPMSWELTELIGAPRPTRLVPIGVRVYETGTFAREPTIALVRGILSDMDVFVVYAAPNGTPGEILLDRRYVKLLRLAQCWAGVTADGVVDPLAPVADHPTDPTRVLMPMRPPVLR